MTASEWLACDDPAPMFDALRDFQPSDRKLRLFACDCCRRLDYLLTDGDRAVVAALERRADGLVSLANVYEAGGVSMGALLPGSTTPAGRVVSEAVSHSPWLAATRARAYTVDAVRATGGAVGRAAEWKRQSDAARCIFGNPFRPVALAPEWLTDTVLALARQMYESGDFSAVPILGDALQDAGCASPDLLIHCQTPAHARGCWAVDLVLDRW